LTGVPVVPGGGGLLESVEHAARVAKETGYPVILKATAGGGGKGMRVVWSESELEHAFDAAKVEAGASFKNDGIYMEKFVEEPRHTRYRLPVISMVRSVISVSGTVQSSAGIRNW